MAPSDSPSRLSRIDTRWTEIGLAHSEGDAAQQARVAVLQRYQVAIQTYVLKLCRGNHDHAEEVFQQFAVGFCSGKMHQASRDKGRFSAYLKRVVHNLVRDLRKKHFQSAAVDLEEIDDPVDTSSPLLEEELQREILDCAWRRLSDYEQEQGSPYFQILLLKVEESLSSKQIAERLSLANAAAARKTLERARKKFSHFVIDEVGEYLGSDDWSAIEAELISLGLLTYCQNAVAERSRR